MIDVTMPQLGESVDTGTITRWLKHAGDVVAVDEPIFEVSSDKVTMEVPSLVAGRIGEIVAQEGVEVPVGSVVARIATTDDVMLSLSKHGPVTAASDPHRVNVRNTGARAFSPVVRRLAREHGIDLTRLNGTAANGRVTKRDVLAFVAAAGNGMLRQAQHDNDALRQAQRDTRDTNGAVGANGAAPPVTLSLSKGAPVSPSSSRGEPFSPLRRTLIQRLSAAQKSAVNVFSVVEIDMENVARHRDRSKEAFRAREGIALTYLPFIARATSQALLDYPALNASIDEAGASLVRHDAVHLGIAVDLDERGLVVPVVRDAHRLTVAGIAHEIARLADAARTNALSPDAYTGSTFSLTNNGAFGALMTAPVINAPNVAIVSTEAVEERPVVIDHMIAIRRRMYLCMTWDHRAFDGSTAARFLARVKHNLETWDWSTQ
ncbi:MAG TPA: 2-oxo acid dehydrogenase subunit E2 [Candidatus Limnocylindria bacterium]|nr:2-oxo acid dehydrogenase subunit E2 [Candidatus Limnocylindria bacterium]